MVGDAGQPAALALSNFADPSQLAVEAAVPAPVAAPAPVETVASAPEAPAASPIELASLSLGTPNVASDMPRFTASPVIQALPAAAPVVAAKPRIVGSPLVQARKTAPQPGKRLAVAAPAAPKVVAGGTHWVQLGSYTDQGIAKEGWSKFTSRTPALKPYRMTTTTATVSGTQVWRVAAAGFATRADAAAMCGKVRSRGGACLVVAAPKPASMGGGSGLARR
jgi:hypothetical protein